MNYYTLAYSTGKDIGSEYPQVAEIIPVTTVEKNHDTNWLIRVNESGYRVPNVNSPIDNFLLEKKAKLTDAISPGYIHAMGLLLNEKLKSIFEMFETIQIKYLKTKILSKKNITYDNYFWAHFCVDYADVINFQKSTFNLQILPLDLEDSDDWDYQTEKLIVNSLEEYILSKKRISTTLKQIIPEVLVLKKEKKVDLFCISGLYQQIIISQELKDEIVNNGISGLEINELKGNIFWE